ncbi:MAG TPA: glycosyltransferase, partial [Gemmata sp.]|nr:glycosyltransferase [Gemmata sp.]
EIATFSVDTVAFPFPESHLPFGIEWRWHRRGARAFLFFEGNRWRVVDADAAVTRRLWRKGPGRLLRILGRVLPVNADRFERAIVRRAVAKRGRTSCAETVLWIDGPPNARLWHDRIARDNDCLPTSLPVPAGRPLRVLQYAGGLYSGGAERQLCNLAIGLAERGVEVAVRTTYDPVEDRGHYTPLLARHGLEVRRAGVVRRGVETSEEAELLSVLPSHLAEQVRELAAELRHFKPDVLHAWLDAPNIVGALAGILAGVPRILLSMRNSNPTHFPRFYHSSMKDWYPIVLASKRVHVLSNSRSGAASYAEWLGIPYSRFHLVANGMHFDHFPAVTPEARQAARAALGLNADDRVVCGIFRLDEEKQPEVFLRVVEEVEQRVPRLRVLLAGTGALASEVETIVRERGLDRFLTLLGRREKVGEVLLASDAMLLTSAVEGCPNAVLEAQYMGVPVVATRGGGTADALLHGETGYLADVGDVSELARRLEHVLTDTNHRAALGTRAAEFIRTEFTLDRMVDLTLLAYHRMHDLSTDQRVLSPTIARLEAETAEPLPPAVATVASFAKRSITPPAILTPPPDTEAEHPELSADETRLVEAVEGHFHLWDAQGVHRLARLARGPIVELGSYLGKSTVALLLGAEKSRQRVHAIDPWFPSNPDVLGYEHTRLFGIDDYLGFCRHVRA